MTEQKTAQSAVLIVDDEPDFCELLAEIVRRQGFLPLTALDAEQALRLVRKQCSKIVLVLADYTMPGMNGLELLHKIRNLGSKARLILLSGDSLVADVLPDRDSRITLLTKPLQFGQLEAILRSLPGG